MSLVLDPPRFAELLNLKITKPGSASLQASIDDLDFGWEPDGSHQVWKLEPTTERYAKERKLIDSFWINIETFWASEGSLGQAKDERINTLLAESPDEGDRKTASLLKTSPAQDTSVKLLEQVRILLFVLVLLVGVLAFRISR